MTKYTIKGLDELLDKLDTLEGLKAAVNGMKAAAVHVKGKIAEYPPSTEANEVKESGSWYERSYGTRWPGGGNKTSETLGRKWTTKEQDRGLTQVIGNNVSYGPYVQSDEDQAFMHKPGYKGRQGWKTDKQVIDEESDRILEFIQDEVDKALEK